jgi:hypothetical protein
VKRVVCGRTSRLANMKSEKWKWKSENRKWMILGFGVWLAFVYGSALERKIGSVVRWNAALSEM